MKQHKTYNEAMEQFMMAIMLLKSVNIDDIDDAQMLKSFFKIIVLLNTCIRLAKKEKKFEEAANLVLLREELFANTDLNSFDTTFMEDDND